MNLKKETLKALNFIVLTWERPRLSKNIWLTRGWKGTENWIDECFRPQLKTLRSWCQWVKNEWAVDYELQISIKVSWWSQRTADTYWECKSTNKNLDYSLLLELPCFKMCLLYKENTMKPVWLLSGIWMQFCLNHRPVKVSVFCLFWGGTFYWDI